MPRQLQTNLGDLMASAAQVDAQAAEMAAGHAAASGQMESAQVGWVGRSALSLGARLVKWQAADAALQGRVVEHGHALQRAAAEYGTTDQRSAEEIEQAEARVDQLTAQQNL